jgi:hypothetical protein
VSIIGIQIDALNGVITCSAIDRNGALHTITISTELIPALGDFKTAQGVILDADIDEQDNNQPAAS